MTHLNLKPYDQLKKFMSDQDNYHYIIYQGYIHKIPIDEENEENDTSSDHLEENKVKT